MPPTPRDRPPPLGVEGTMSPHTVSGSDLSEGTGRVNRNQYGYGKIQHSLLPMPH